MSDRRLLNEFMGGSERAFEELVKRHSGLVYSVCLRRVRDPVLAEDATQAVFILLARNARKLPESTLLPGWFVNVSKYVAARTLRTEFRQKAREAEVGKMRQHTDNTVGHQQLTELLDDALDRLNSRERDVVILKFFEERSFKEVAEVLKISEKAAEKRVARALIKLKGFVAKKGAVVPMAVVAAALSNTVRAMPSIQAESIARDALAGATNNPALNSCWTIANDAAHMMTMAKVKSAGILVCATLLLAVCGMFGHHWLGADETSLPVVPAPEGEKAEIPEKLPYPVSKISGVVIDDKSNLPVAGVTVGLVGYYFRKMTEDPKEILPLPGAKSIDGAPVTVSGADGTYELSFMTSLRDRLSLNIAIWGMSLTSDNKIAVYQGEAVVAEPLKVTRTSAVTVRVVDDKGVPLIGANVRQSGSEFKTDKDGHFTDSTVPLHVFSWDVAAPGFELMRFRYWIGDGKRDPVIQLVPCKSVTGKVVDAAGQPVPNIRVYGGSEHLNSRPNWFTETDAKGEFVMATMLQNNAPTPIFPVRGSDIIGEKWRVTAGQIGVVLKLFPTGRFEATAEDEKGQPIASQELRLRPTGDDLGKIRWMVTNAKGLAIIENMPLGTFKLDILRPNKGLVAPIPCDVVIAEHRTSRTKLICPLTNNVRVTGFIVDKQGLPVLHAMVMVCLKPANADKWIVQDGLGYVEVDGHFEIELHKNNRGNRDRTPMWEAPEPDGPGKIRICAIFTDGLGNAGQHFVDDTRVWVQDSPSLDCGRLQVNLDPVRYISADSFLPGGTDAHGWCTAARSSDGQKIDALRLLTSNGGKRRMRIAIRNSGALTLNFENEVGDTIAVAVPASDKDSSVQVHFPKPRSVAFSVLDENDRPLKGIQFHKLGFPKDMKNGYGISSDDQGQINFECSAQATGTFYLSGPLQLYEIYFGEIAASEAALVQTIRLKNVTATLSGRMLDKKGMPVPNARLTARVSISAGERVVTSSLDVDVKKDGSYSTRIPSGVSVQLLGYDSEIGYSVYSESVKVTAGQKISLNVTLYHKEKAHEPIRKQKPPPQEGDF